MEESAVVLARNVEKGVEGDHGSITPRREVHAAEVGAEESRPRHEPARPTHLDVGNIDAGDVETAREESRARNARAATQVEDGGAGRKMPS